MWPIVFYYYYINPLNWLAPFKFLPRMSDEVIVGMNSGGNMVLSGIFTGNWSFLFVFLEFQLMWWVNGRLLENFLGLIYFFWDIRDFDARGEGREESSIGRDHFFLLILVLSLLIFSSKTALNFSAFSFAFSSLSSLSFSFLFSFHF